MASQSSFEEVATPIENPTTPQPQDLDLPAKADLPSSISPTTSMLVAGSSSVLHPSSMTPPPSSQAPPVSRIASSLRSITPPDTAATGTMSSPPPSGMNGTKREAPNTVVITRLTVDQVANATKEELKAFVEKFMAENNKLDAEASEARMSAAHYKLQYQLLTIESEEALKRMEVEHDITRREVEVLQGTGRESTYLEYTQKLKAHCKVLEDDIQLFRRRLENAKRVIQDKEDELTDAREEIGRLYERIRQNREHINVLRSPGGPLHVATPKTPATPHHYRGTPRYTPSARQIRYPASQDNQERFNALLLAGESVLSQENNSAPSTPTVARHTNPRTPNKHNRGVQSMSAFPTTPGSGRPMTANSTLLPAAEISQAADARINVLAHNALQQLNQSQPRRRKSRDSTISASDHEEIVRATNTSYREDSEEIQESQASQSATEMLRADPRESFEVAASRTHTPIPSDKPKTHQSKLFAPISKIATEKNKGGAEKRKRDEEYGPMKKARSDAEAIGLGIGFETGRA
ncbi:hypothetical protein EG329_009144 [Mollisiaceae sp. DMI_Dod_QoI]|nr:hypothetical protein EG329_009144 [Helotiales sp. DMI_Dod_QoI]